MIFLKLFDLCIVEELLHNSLNGDQTLWFSSYKSCFFQQMAGTTTLAKGFQSVFNP